MAEERVIIGIPIVLMLAMLLLFGVTWLFHHHHWRPFAGVFLFIVGLGIFWVLMRASVHVEQQQAPQAELRRSDRWDRGDGGTIETSRSLTGDERSMKTKSSTNGRDKEVFAEKPPGEATPPSATKTAEKVAEAPSSSTAPTDAKDADKRPDWVERPPKKERINGEQVYVASATSGPYTTPAECDRAIIPAVNEIVGNYVVNYVAEADGEPIALDADYIRGTLIQGEHWELVNRSVGQMNQLHVRLAFDSRVRDELERRARSTKVEGRLQYAAAGTALTLLLLGGIYSILKKGTARRSAVT